MVTKDKLKVLSSRLTALRASLLVDYPFYGRLLLRLQFGYAQCGTAQTDMRKIVFDPSFSLRLSDDEMRFVLLHEVLHCVLHHCTRGRSLQQDMFNIACDIVVNSLILETIHAESFCVDGQPVIHLTPTGKEGREYSAEEVYDMLMDTSAYPQAGLRGDSFRDSHAIWIDASPVADDKWDQYIREAAKTAGNQSGIPYGLKRHLKENNLLNRLDWRLILHDFIQYTCGDFTYDHPDPRYQGDVIIPSYVDNIWEEKVEKIWFLIDTSGSVTDSILTESFNQIKQAVEQIDNLYGSLSFFDSMVTEPIPFSSIEDLDNISPVGGGGTNFINIFKYYDEHFSQEDRPSCVIILTDGYAEFPTDDQVRTDKLLWLVLSNDIIPPVGDYIHLDL